MPDRFWVGGTANWDGPPGLKWAATSGGPGGASVPTTADDVFFTNLSTGTCTIGTGNALARSINCTGFTGTIAGTGNITVAGSVTLVTAMTWTHSGTVTFTGTGTLTTAGKVFSAVTVNGAGITLTLGDALNTGTRTLTVTQGTFTTNNFSVTANALSSSNANTRAINLGASTVTVTGTNGGLDFSNSTNLTFNAGTSSINMQVNTSFLGGGRTFHNVSFTNTSLNTNNRISGTNTFNNLTVNAPGAGSSLRFLTIEGNQTINGTLTCGGASPIRRIFVRSDTIGTARTLTVAALAANDCDFRDIVIAGAAAGTAPTRASDCGGNSGITFPAAKTVYRVGTAVSWMGSSSWALASGAAGSDNNFPLAQDTAVIDNSTALTGTLSLDSANIGSLDASTRTTGITLNHNSGPPRYGSYILGSGVTITGTSTQTFSGRGTMNFDRAGKTITFPINVEAPGGTFRQLSATTMSSFFTLATGTLDLNNLTLTATSLSGSGTATRSIAFGVGNIALSGSGTVWNFLTTDGLTVTGTPVVNVNNNTATATTVANVNLSEANSISFNFTTGTYALTLFGNSTFKNLNFTGFSGNLVGGTRSIFGNLTLSTGMTLSSSANATTFASTSGTPLTITTNGKTLDFPLTFNGVGGTFRLLDALTMGSTRTLTHTNGTIDLNGFNLTVGAAYTTAAGTKNLTFNAGTLTCPAPGNAFNNAQPTNFTTTAGTGTGTINMTAATSKNFFGGDLTFNCTLNNGGAGALNIYGSNTFTTLANSVQPTSFLFEDSETTTLTNWNISGTPGNLVTINSIVGANLHGLSKASGTVNADYLSITNSYAFGGATWNAGDNSINGGNNSGWTFGPVASGGGSFFVLLR